MRICGRGFRWGVIGYSYELPEVGNLWKILSRFVLDPGDVLRRWIQGPEWMVAMRRLAYETM